MACRFILGGYSFADFKCLVNNWSEVKLQNREWVGLEENLFYYVDLLSVEILKERRKKFVGSDVRVLVDCRWSKPSDACAATVTCFNVDNNQLLCVYNLQRKTNSLDDFEGSAKAMEGFGTKEICKIFKEENINISVLLHDGDSSALSNAREVFPKIEEWRCLNHAKKNFRSELNDLKESKHPDVRKLVISASNAFQSAVRQANKSEEILENFKHSINHWQGNHTNCKHGPLTQTSVLTKKGAKKLLAIFEKHIDGNKSQALLAGLTTNVAESFNSLIAYYAPKAKHYPENYRSLVNLAVLHKIVGVCFPLVILEQLGFSFFNSTYESFIQLMVLREKDRIRKLSKEFKTQRIVCKQRKIAAAAKAKKKHTDCLYKDKKLEVSCNCMSMCLTRRCPCRKNETGCSNTCACRGKCDNYYNDREEESEEEEEKTTEKRGKKIEKNEKIVKKQVAMESLMALWTKQGHKV
eukprot:TRINITY_DN1889_c0_g1_i8.p1 TRINITY_DN1889_c0_g1~~TRINITY_DN1889_c0_g1_i8.p1  ORF type:complete len:542 (-),score=76.12 TRINITY_DN1889_c0_g1_i8:18-1418(-)